MEDARKPDEVAMRVAAMELALAVLIADARKSKPTLFDGVRFVWREGFDAGEDGDAIADAINGHVARLVENSHRL